MDSKQSARDMLNKINSKSGKKYGMDDIKSISRGYSMSDVTNEKKLEELIKKVSNMAGVNVSGKRMEEIKKQISSRFSK